MRPRAPIRRPAASDGWLATLFAGPAWTGLIGAGVLAVVFVAAVATRPPPVPDSNGCVLGLAHRSLAIVVDTTDPLIAAEPRQTREAVDEALAVLKPNDRVTVLEMSGQATAEARPLVDACLPGDETNVERNRLRDRLVAPIATRLAALAGRPEAPTSPLIETLLSLASERALNGPSSRLTVLMITDGLQNSALASAYRGGGPLRHADGQPLRGVRVDLFIIQNSRDAALQPHGARALVAWLDAAGAVVDYAPPPWMSVLAHAKHSEARR